MFSACTKTSAEPPTVIPADKTSLKDTVSLAYFSQRPFDGGDLRIEKTLEKTDAYTRYAIRYRSGNLSITGIMNVPKGSGPFPVLILNHGYIPPKIYTTGRGLKREQDYLARNGYVVIHPDYRNHAGSDKDTANDYRFRLGYTEDVIHAVMAVKNSSYAFLDKERIGMLGHSMGGGIAMNIMVTQPGLVRAYVLYGTVSAEARDNFFRWTIRRPDGDSIIRRYGHPDSLPEFWRSVSPMTYLHQTTEPVLIHHGTADESCPVDWARKLRDSLMVHRKEALYFEYPNGKHEFINEWPVMMKRTVEFFRQHLSGHRKDRS